ncbi:3-deoxy-D-manno-octulosonic acid transferase [Flavobacteriaceae bacterium TP-CH-4]|uniref:3-deoxy-D-manno-octulosonic acid transferase n=1 Tax=Pelagihabitans pacificus TaxID=2696054 RepID=A0A967AQE0_9FLAO|nr:glycosyltransferase N-terminal domain-containing protein [Pelagihabitans pacificus]NHF58439.1 3-deoxy-D-manno-octulosonic acid transferase [Pelagihabitans pacificus]
MFTFYNLIVHISWFFLKIMAPFSGKMKLFVQGRKQALAVLRERILETDRVFWMHAASLGEFEQGLPIVEKLKVAYPSHKFLITFFSPSGYEVKKNTQVADIVTYLPMDTRENVASFLQIVRPELAIFVKYEIWPNYLKALKDKKIPTVLISALFKKKQIYFKGYGGFMRNSLRSFSHIFVQNDTSEALLKSIGIAQVTVSGDTRLDRVSEILERDNTLDFMDIFKKDKLCFVAGSTWPEDESILIDYINHAPKRLKYVLAPHTIKKDKILGLAGSLTKKTVLYSKMDLDSLGDYEVLIVDHIGVLTKIYHYADIAYVGGAFATGLHNTMEPAVFGIPVIIGPQYSGFREAEELVSKKGIISITDKWGFGEVMKKMLDDPEFRRKTGLINAYYISENKGASIQIMDRLRTLL